MERSFAMSDPTKTTTSPPGECVSVLVVEDDPVFSLQLQMMLQKAGGSSIRVTRAGDMAETEAALRAGGIDVVLLDLNLPDSEGVDTVHRVFAVNRSVPVVVITASDDDELAHGALQAGAREFLVKGDERARHILRTIRFVMGQHKQEMALQASEQRFRDFADVAADWFFETGADLRFTWFSERATALMGFESDFLIGRRRDEVCAPEDAEKVGEHMGVMERREEYRNFVYCLNWQGVRRYLRVSGRPVFGGDGGFLGYRGVGSDVTAEIEAERFALSMLSVLMDSLSALPYGIMVFDADDRLIVANDGVGGLIPCCADHLIPGTTFLDLLKAAVEADCIARPDEGIDAWIANWRGKARQSGMFIEPTRNGVKLYFHQYPTATGGMLRMVRFERGIHPNQD